MNQFQSTESGAGILKPDYGPDPVGDALKRRREKLAETKLGIAPEERDDERDA